MQRFRFFFDVVCPYSYLESRVVEAAVAAYDGALVLATHDRAFARATTTTTWVVEGGTVAVAPAVVPVAAETCARAGTGRQQPGEASPHSRSRRRLAASARRT